MFNQKQSNVFVSEITLNLSSIRQNYNQIIRPMLNPKVKIIAMVKSNAYGHGVIEVSRILEQEKVDFLGVFCAEEAKMLRTNGIQSPIIIFGIPCKEELDMISSMNTSVVLSSTEEFQNILQWSEKSKKVLKVHLKIDTGMGRLGLFPDQALSIIQNIICHQQYIEMEGICTHFSESSSLDKSYTMHQGNIFNRLLDELNQKKIPLPLIHAANSGAILHYPEYHYSAVRPGILLYGVCPDHTEIPGLAPALSLSSYVGSIKLLPENAYISYGRSFKTQRKTKIAIIPLGYADGLPWSLSNSGHVLIRDHFFPIVGSVCMNQFMVDITDQPGIYIGDRAIIIGKDMDNQITAHDLAQSAGTIPYEILCRLSVFHHRRFY